MVARTTVGAAVEREHTLQTHSEGKSVRPTMADVGYVSSTMVLEHEEEQGHRLLSLLLMESQRKVA